MDAAPGWPMQELPPQCPGPAFSRGRVCPVQPVEGCGHTKAEVATAQAQASIAQLQAELATLRQEKQALEEQLLRTQSRCTLLEDELDWQAALQR